MMATQAMYTIADDQPASDCSAPIDLKILERRCMGNGDLVSRLLNEFQLTLPRSVDVLDHYLSAGEESQLAEAAHSLKGAAGIIAADSVAKLAASIEVAVRAKELVKCNTLLSCLRQAVSECIEQLEDRRNGRIGCRG